MAASSTELADAFTREHHQIDAGIERYISTLDTGGDTGALRSAMHALRRHIYLEERFMFPPLRAAGMLMPILVMLNEHGELWRAMDALDESFTAGADAEQLRDQCQAMLSLLEAHNRKEEPIIYPRLDTDLPEDERQQLAHFLKAGTLPDGWVCEQANA